MISEKNILLSDLLQKNVLHWVNSHVYPNKTIITLVGLMKQIVDKTNLHLKPVP